MPILDALRIVFEACPYTCQPKLAATMELANSRKTSYLPPYHEEGSVPSLAVTETPSTSRASTVLTLSSCNRTEHRYSKTKGTQSRPWLTLIVRSKAARPDSLPYFFGHAPITGRVEYDLKKPESILGMSLEVRITRHFFPCN